MAGKDKYGNLYMANGHRLPPLCNACGDPLSESDPASGLKVPIDIRLCKYCRENPTEYGDYELNLYRIKMFDKWRKKNANTGK